MLIHRFTTRIIQSLPGQIHPEVRQQNQTTCQVSSRIFGMGNRIDKTYHSSTCLLPLYSSLFIPVKIFFKYQIFSKVFFIGGFPIIERASYPTLVIGKSY